MGTIQLTRGYVALVDDEDLHLSVFQWYPRVCKLRGGGVIVYAQRNVKLANGKWTTHTMHREIMEGVGEIDHKDNNGLNNQRGNLRASTRSQNQANSRKKPGSSIYKGVYLHQSGKWQAVISKGGCRQFLGTFKEEHDAAQAYNLEAAMLFGEFANLNVPKERPCNY